MFKDTYYLAAETYAGEATLTPQNDNYCPVICSSVLNVNSGDKVGYLNMSAFNAGDDGAYNDRMKQVMSMFADAAVKYLVLDLRYNSGSDLSGAQLLASMLVPHDLCGEFVRLKFNKTRMAQMGAEDFVSVPFLSDADMRSGVYGSEAVEGNLNLSSVYVLCSSATAESSEALISALKAAGMTVYLIGEHTRGQCVGSEFISSASEDKRFENYVYEMCVVTYSFHNSDGGLDFADGFAPDCFYDECDDIEWLAFGDPDERLLSIALRHIETGEWQ
jgi:hypothetical protein